MFRLNSIFGFYEIMSLPLKKYMLSTMYSCWDKAFAMETGKYGRRNCGSKGKEEFRRPLHKIKAFLNGEVIQKSAQVGTHTALISSNFRVIGAGMYALYTQASMPFLGSVGYNQGITVM